MIEPYFETDNGKLYNGGCLDILKQMPDESVDCVVTSPPYWGLRDYSTDGQIGLEPTIQEYINVMTEIFGEVRRVLKRDGTLWLNMGDSYATAQASGDKKFNNEEFNKNRPSRERILTPAKQRPDFLKNKDLIGMPWRVAFALQDDGWYLRSDIIWHKPNPMPESVTDRPTKSHEYIFLMSKSSQYFYDAEAIMEPVSKNTHLRISQNVAAQVGSDRAHAGGKINGNMKAVIRTPKQQEPGKGIRNNDSFNNATCLPVLERNKRTVWTIPTQGYSEAHFATYPVNLIYPCIKAGCRPGGIVMDPFIGSGTTAIVAEKLNRRWIGIEINADYIKIAKERIKKETAQYKLEFT